MRPGHLRPSPWRARAACARRACGCTAPLLRDYGRPRLSSESRDAPRPALRGVSYMYQLPVLPFAFRLYFVLACFTLKFLRRGVSLSAGAGGARTRVERGGSRGYSLCRVLQSSQLSVQGLYSCTFIPFSLSRGARATCVVRCLCARCTLDAAACTGRRYCDSPRARRTAPGRGTRVGTATRDARARPVRGRGTWRARPRPRRGGHPTCRARAPRGAPAGPGRVQVREL